MKEKTKQILTGVGLIVAGIVGFLIADEYVFMLFHAIPVDFRIVGAIFAVMGVLNIVMALVKKRPDQNAEPAPRKERPARRRAEAAVPPPAPVQSAAPAVDAAAVLSSAKSQNTPEGYRAAIDFLEKQLEAAPGNQELAQGTLAAYDGYLRSRGERSFGDYQQRFYAALRAIYMEEQNGLPRSTRRFWAIHSAVHGGIAAASAKDLDQLEDALLMLERASQMQPEGSRPVDEKYVQTAVPSVRCWVAYWVARICATEKPDYPRSAEALQLAAQLFPREGEGLRACDLNPHLESNTKVLLTMDHLEALRKHLLAKARQLQ